jgi:hypothetical protein
MNRQIVPAIRQFSFILALALACGGAGAQES